MRMIPKQEFTEELLNKYEIANGLSVDIINSMISRGFIPSVTNEVGDQTYNIDYYLEHEDVFNERLTDFKNTQGYYTDYELKTALTDRDSSFEGVAANAFNELARRGLIDSDDVFEVQTKKIYLFSPNLIFEIDAIKAALEELDVQLEAEEVEEMLLLPDESEEDVEENAEQESHSSESEEFLEEDERWDDDEDDLRKEKKKRQEKRARERRRKEEQKRAEEQARIEEAKLEEARLHSSEAVKSTPIMSNSDSETTVSHTEQTLHDNASAQKEQSAPKYETSKTEIVSSVEQQASYDVKDTYTSETTSKRNEDYRTTQSHKKTSEDNFSSYEKKEQPENVTKTTVEHKESDVSKSESSTRSEASKSTEYVTSSEPHEQRRADDYSDKQESYAAEKRKEEAAKAQYEAERRKSQEDVAQETKAKLRNEDGTFTFTGTEIGKTAEPTASEQSVSEPSGEPQPYVKTETSASVERHRNNADYSQHETTSVKETTKANDVSHSRADDKQSEKAYNETKTSASVESVSKAKSKDEHKYDTYTETKETSAKQAFQVAEQTQREAEVKYETERRKTQDAPSESVKSRLRSDSGDFVFTGTKVGKEDVATASEVTKETASTHTGFSDRSDVDYSQHKPETIREQTAEPTKQHDDVKDSSLQSESKSYHKTDTVNEQERDVHPASKVEYNEPYKVNVPLADGSYMTFEALPKEETATATPERDTKHEASYTSENSDTKQEIHKENGYKFTGTSIGENSTQTATTSDFTSGSIPHKSEAAKTSSYDNYVTRAQAAYVSQGVVLSQAALNEIISKVNTEADGQGFRVSISRAQTDGGFKHEEVYNSREPQYSVGHITDAYKEASRVDFLPTSSSEQTAKDNNVLFAIGIQAGGSVKDDTYIPPAVPTIHPRVFDDLKKQGVKYVQVNDAKVTVSDMARISRSEISIVENPTAYVNEIVAREQIAQATKTRSKYGIEMQQEGTSVERARSAEKIIVAASDARTAFNNAFFINSIKSSPEFVPAYLREVYKEQPKSHQETSDRDVSVRTQNGFSSVRTLGSASELSHGQRHTSSDATNAPLGPTIRPSVFNDYKSPSRASQQQIRSQQLGTATAVLEVDPIRLDFSKPELIEKYAKMAESDYPELAKELRRTSKAINGDIAAVLAGEGTYVDGARLIQRPETFVLGKAEYAAQVADAIESRYPQNAARIREISASLNSSGQSIDTKKDIFRQFDITKATPEEMVAKAQELLKTPRSLKGNAREVEEIAAIVERTRGDIANQLRQASKTQNGNVADVYAKATRLERKFNNAYSSFDYQTQPFGSQGFSGWSGTAQPQTDIKTGIIRRGGNSDVEKINKFRRMSPANMKVTTNTMIFETKGRFGRKSYGTLTENADGTINASFNEGKKSSMSVLGYASDVATYDTTDIKSAAMSKTKLARIATQKRKLSDLQFKTAKGAQFALNEQWKRKNRKKYNVKHGKVKDIGDFEREMTKNAEVVNRMYQDALASPDAWEELFDRNGFSGDGSVVIGLRGAEVLKKQRREALPNIASNILWRTMPTQELNQTYLGSGYRYLLGRGSMIWTVSNIGAALDAKDKLQSMNQKMLINDFGGTVKLPYDTKTYSFRSAKDRRELSKKLSHASKASMGVDITRFTTNSLTKMLQTGKTLGGVTLTADQLELVRATLRLKGISEGTLSVVTPYDYLQARNLMPFDSSLSAKYKTLLGDKSIEQLNKGEIALLLQNNPTMDKELKDALLWAQKFNGLTMDSKEAISAIIEAIDAAGLDVRFEEIMKGLKISDLSEKQIAILLKSDDVPEELKKLLSETSKLRGLADKRSELRQTIGKLKQTAGFWARKAMMKFRGTDLGDGVYAVYSAVHTAKTTIMVFNQLRNYNKIMKASLRNWIARGSHGSLRHKIANTRLYRLGTARRNWKNARKARRQAASRQRTQRRLARKQQRKLNRADRRAKRAKKFNKRHPNAGRKIKKVKKGSRIVKNRIGRIGGRFGKIGRGIKKAIGTVLKPFKIVSGLINKVKGFLIKKFIMPFVAICGIFLLLITAIEIGIGAFGAGASAVYSTIQFLNNDNLKETTGMDTEQRLIDNTVELCINLDSALKYYNEKFYTESKVVNAVKDAIKSDTEHKEECKNFYDPKTNDTLALKRLGTTLNGIQTGVYYTYYNGDAEEIGFKSNSKDIASMANAWAGGDFHAKGLYKSYVEKLWNYSHVVAYSPRKQGTGAYGGKYVYACSSNEESSECYENEYSYKCHDSGANVYETGLLGKVTGVKTSIQNGNDRTSGKVNGSYINNTSTLKTSYTVQSGIVKYNEYGCSQHKLTYHKGPSDKKFSGLAAQAVSLPNGLSATIEFYSNGDKTKVAAPAGCTNWKYIETAYKKADGTAVPCRAYYCAGCCGSCSESSSQPITITTKKVATHTGSWATTIDDKTYYNAGTISGCEEKETKYHSGDTKTYKGHTYNHVLGTSYSSCYAQCNNLGNFTVSNSSSSTTYCSTGYCKKVTSTQTCNYKVSLSDDTYEGGEYIGVNIANPLHGEIITVMGKTFWAYKVNGLKIKVYAAAPSGWTVSKTKTIDFKTYKSNFYHASTTIDGTEYVWDIRVRKDNINKTYSSEKLTCYKAKCSGHKTTTTTSTTYYYCLGHERCKGYLKDSSANITVNYCKGYCPGHTLEHYCTGHVDLNVAVVTLFLDDTNSMAYLGIPKTVKSEILDDVKVQDESSVKNEITTTREVQAVLENAEYLYNNVFGNYLFKEFDYEKYPLPDMSVIGGDFTLDLQGSSVSDPGNFGNPLDTLRWNETFVTDTVKKDSDGKKTLNSVISSLFSTFSTEGVWEDKNDAFSSFATVSAGNVANSYFKDFSGLTSIDIDVSKWSKHHYFSGFFKYSDNTSTDDDGNTIKQLLLHTNADGSQTPIDNGPYSRAIEALKEDWYETYGIVFPGAYNVLIEDEEITKILKNMTTCAAGTLYQNYVTKNQASAKQLLQSMGSTTSESSISFAANWFKVFYQNVNSSGPKGTQINNALTIADSYTNQTDQGKAFRKSLNVQSLQAQYSSQTNIDAAICNLHVGDLLGAGDEVYVVLYNDTNARTYPNGTNSEKRGIAKGHIIVATVNGAAKDATHSNLDSIHMFSFTTEYVSKKAELFWVYKCE